MPHPDADDYAPLTKEEKEKFHPRHTVWFSFEGARYEVDVDELSTELYRAALEIGTEALLRRKVLPEGSYRKMKERLKRRA